MTESECQDVNLYSLLLPWTNDKTIEAYEMRLGVKPDATFDQIKKGRGCGSWIANFVGTTKLLLNGIQTRIQARQEKL